MCNAKLYWLVMNLLKCSKVYLWHDIFHVHLKFHSRRNNLIGNKVLFNFKHFCILTPVFHVLIPDIQYNWKRIENYSKVSLYNQHAVNLKVYDPIPFGFIHRNGVFGIRRKTLIVLITPVKYYGQEMLILNVTSENVAKVQKLL